MADFAHEWTDKRIEELEERVRQIYEQASKEMEQKFFEANNKFIELNAEKYQQVKDGLLTDQEYQTWRRARQKDVTRYRIMSEKLAEEMVNSNRIALSLIYENMPDAYAINYDFAAYEFTEKYGGGYTFTLYNREAVENLLKDDESLLPYASSNSPKAQLLRERADLIWNRQKINNAITQGIMQGESVYKVATRLQKVSDMNRAAAVRNARTMMGAAQNRGRNDVYEELKKEGADVKCIWVATLDGHTRHSHAMLHGTEKGEDGLYMNGLEYPCDPFGAPAEVYNCRCTEVTIPADMDFKVVSSSPNVDEGGFDDWINSYGDPSTISWWNEQKQTMRNEQINTNVRETKKEDPVFTSIQSRLEGWNVEKNPVGRHSETLEDFEIIEKLGGGDMTNGSCASLAMCYAGNRAGYDVEDFRGGTSQQLFSQNMTLNRITEMQGVNGQNFVTNTERKDAWNLLHQMEPGKEYILGLAQHMSVVKYDETFGYLYLELQSPTSNGWKQLDDNVLTNRFRCPKRKTKYGNSIQWMEVDNLGANEDFGTLLEYINTDPGKQKKGGSGYAK